MRDIISTDKQNEILYSELFYSIQGEGKFTGIPTCWVRLFACNLSCSGFGQTDPTDPDTYRAVGSDFDLSSIDELTDLPVFEYGCDSAYSVAAKYKHLMKSETAETIADQIRELITNEHNQLGKFKYNRHMCFTGGEPMLPKNQRSIVDITDALLTQDNTLNDITIETNGTQKLTDEFVEYMGRPSRTNIFMSVSPKLFTVSGERAEKAIKPGIVASYADLYHGQLKFVVVNTPECWDELEMTIAQFRDAGCFWPVWVMPCGGTEETQREVAADITEEAIRRGYNVSARVHAYIWGNSLGT